MVKTIYRQFDSRWGSLPYPSKKTNLSNAGCGCLSVFHCAIENPKYAKLTVKQCQQFMLKYSRSGNGTDWSGIKAGLENYGYNVHWKQSDGMKEIWAALKSSKKMGVILFHSGKGPNGTVWTSSGHYIAFTDYRIKDGRHEFYCKDSGTRKHDGWYSYERSMKGCIKFVYVRFSPFTLKVEASNTCRVPALMPSMISATFSAVPGAQDLPSALIITASAS